MVLQENPQGLYGKTTDVIMNLQRRGDVNFFGEIPFRIFKKSRLDLSIAKLLLPLVVIITLPLSSVAPAFCNFTY